MRAFIVISSVRAREVIAISQATILQSIRQHRSASQRTTRACSHQADNERTASSLVLSVNAGGADGGGDLVGDLLGTLARIARQIPMCGCRETRCQFRAPLPLSQRRLVPGGG